MATRPLGKPPSPSTLTSPVGAPDPRRAAIPASPVQVTGAIGTPPPPGAPIHERNEPLKPELIAEQVAKAQANEQTLAPLAFETAPVPPGPHPPGAPFPVGPKTSVSLKPSDAVTEDLTSVAAALAESLESRGKGLDPAPATEGAPTPGEEPDARSADGEEGTALVPNPFPAGSSTDSPSRGIPHPSQDPGKTVTGGFGVGAMEYFALDGSEVAAIATRLVQRLLKQVTTDLRLGLAITYPQVRIRAAILIDGASEDATVHSQAFDLVDAEILHLEAVEVDDPETPPDALRIEAGLDRPYKRVVQMGAGRTIADREVR